MRTGMISMGVGALFCGMAIGQGAAGATGSRRNEKGPEQSHNRTLTFEVATVRPHTGNVPLASIGIHGGPGTDDPSQINFTFVPMKELLLRAYGVRSPEVSGPSWMDTERYDIAAKVPLAATEEEANVMLQNLLVERFGLVFHREKKELQVYELTIGKDAPKLRESLKEDPLAKPGAPPSRGTTDKNGVPQLPPGPPGTVIALGTGRTNVYRC